jgi:hypothetical protein
MGTITNAKGEIVGTFDDTLEDWKQAAEIEAQIRREAQEEIKQLKAEIKQLNSRRH